MIVFEYIDETPPVYEFDKAIVDAIVNGFPHDADRLAASATAHQYYDLNNKALLRKGRLDDPDAFSARELITFPVVRRVIDSMTRLLYPTKPIRKFNDPSAQAYLDNLYSDVVIDDLMMIADRYALLNGAVAIHPYVAHDKIDITLYGGDEFVPVFGKDPLNPEAVILIRTDPEHGEVYEVWTSELYGEVRIDPKRSRELVVVTAPTRNQYGVLPFVFGHASRPIRSFWEGGIGKWLAQSNHALDAKAADASANEEYSKPIGFWANTEPGSSIIAQAGYFNRLPPDGEVPAYLESGYNAAAGVESMKEWLFTFAGMLGVPRSELEGIVDSGDSGIAIMLRRLPLYELAMQRQPNWSRCEQQLARLVWKMAPLVPGFAPGGLPPEALKLTMIWQPPSIPLRTPDKSAMDATDLSLRLTSRTKIIQRDYGLTEQQANEFLDQVDTAEATVATPTDGVTTDGTASDATGDEQQPGPGRFDIGGNLTLGA